MALKHVMLRYREGNMGLYDEELNKPLPAFYCFQLLNEEFSDFESVSAQGSSAAPVYEFAFPGGMKKYICWSENGRRSLDMSIPDGRYQVIKFITEMGKSTPDTQVLDAQSGKLHVEVDSTPVIIKSQ